MKKLIAVILILITVCSTFFTALAKENWASVVDMCRKGAKTFGVTCKPVNPETRKKYQLSSVLQGFPDEYMALTLDESLSGASGLVIHTDDGTYEIYFSEILLGLLFVAGLSSSLSENKLNPYEYDFILLDENKEQYAMSLGNYYDTISPILKEYGLN